VELTGHGSVPFWAARERQRERKMAVKKPAAKKKAAKKFKGVRRER
jgi:hypothetical protein